MAIGFLDFAVAKPGFLDFGGSGAGGFDNELLVEGTLAKPTGIVLFRSGYLLRKEQSQAWRCGIPSRQEQGMRWQNSQRTSKGLDMPWTAGLRTASVAHVFYTAGQQTADQRNIPWNAGQALSVGLGAPWDAGRPESSAIAALWNSGWPLDEARRIVWQNADPRRDDRAVPFDHGLPHEHAAGIPWDSADKTLYEARIPWDAGGRIPHGWRPILLPPPGGTRQRGRLNFACLKGSGFLNFGHQCQGSGALSPPRRRSYRVINAAALIRVSDSADIPVSNLSIALDQDAWCWTLSATLIGRTAYETVPDSPGLVQATINGFVWRFVVDDVDYSRAFGTFGGQLTGRSPIALMAEPYAATRSYLEDELRTAQQLTLQELPSGFSLITTLPDWTVPADTYQYENLTPMESVIRITKACGGRVIPDREDTMITCAPKWPRMPWNWTDPADVTLPSSYTLREALQNSSGVEYEAILVSGGVRNGIVAMCTRTGTGGTVYAPSVVDSLITHLDAAMARANQEIADAWPMKRYTLDLPLQETPSGAGLLVPGTVIDFDDGVDGWRGLVVKCAVTATWNQITQSLEIVAP